MRRSLHFLRLLSCLGPLAMAAHAEPAPAPTVSARLHFISVAEREPAGLFVMIDKKPVAFRAPADFFGPALDYRGPATLDVFQTGATPPPAPPAPGTPGVAAPVPIATTELSEAGGEFVVLIGEAGGVRRLAVLDFSAKTTPEGGYLLWNLTNRRIAVTLDNTQATMPAGSRSVLVPTTAAGGYMPLRVFDEFEGRDREVFAARHYHTGKTRQLVFITNGANPARVRLKIITERPAAVVPSSEKPVQP